MLDIKRIRKRSDEVAAGLLKKGYTLDLAAFNALDARRKALDTQSQELLAERKLQAGELLAEQACGPEAAALLASKAPRLLVTKTKGDGVTVAAARIRKI